MSKFRVGDRVRILGGTMNNHRIGDVGIITGNDDDDYPGQTDSDRLYTVHTESDDCPYYPQEIKLIKGEQTMGRRTFRLLKETPEWNKGALVQEKCDDGNQDFKLIGGVDSPFLKEEGHYEDGAHKGHTSRKAVLNQPKWFEEVFPLVPEYGNKAELEAFKRFSKKGK